MNDYAFLHGGAQGGWVWDETINAMRAQDNGALGRLLALDVPGCGAKRNRPTGGLGIAEVAFELIEDIERAGLEQVILVGHSQAGQVLPVMARLRPGLFRRLVYVTCSAPLPGQSVLQMIGRSRRGMDTSEVGWPMDPNATSMSERMPAMYCNDMRPEQLNTFREKLGKDMWPPATYSESGWRYDDLGRVPASYVVCLQDQSLPEDWQLKFAQRLKAERLVRIDAGHQVMNTRPHALAEALLIEADF